MHRLVFLSLLATLTLGASKPSNPSAEVKIVPSDAELAKKEAKPADSIRILPVRPTPEPEAATVKISLPKNGATVNGNPVWVQFRVQGYAIGAASQFDRGDEIAVSEKGQTVHLIIDNMPYYAINDPALDPFIEAGWYYENNYRFEIPDRLSKGEHVIRAFLARSYGEALKGEQTFFVTKFYLGNTEPSISFDFSKPYLTYNEPSNELYLTEDTPVLLDFYISNCELTNDGYKVKLDVDGTNHRTITSWQPYYIYGLKKGKHKIHLELVDSAGKVVSGPFNDTERTITIH